MVSAKGNRTTALETEFENYLLVPVLYQEDQILQLSRMVVKKPLLELGEADGEFARVGFGHVQGSSELSVGLGGGLLAQAWGKKREMENPWCWGTLPPGSQP